MPRTRCGGGPKGRRGPTAAQSHHARALAGNRPVSVIPANAGISPNPFQRARPCRGSPCGCPSLTTPVKPLSQRPHAPLSALNSAYSFVVQKEKLRPHVYPHPPNQPTRSVRENRTDPNTPERRPTFFSAPHLETRRRNLKEPESHNRRKPSKTLAIVAITP